jgi:ribosomal protein S18 acetylase RimI-like enzyme
MNNNLEKITSLELTDPSRETATICESLEDQIRRVHDITAFYNKFFPKSPHNEKYKQELYQDESRKPIVLTITSNQEIVGLLESWVDQSDPTKRILSTILVDPRFRNKGYAKELFNQANQLAREDKENSIWVLHFRDSNREILEPMYASFGFGNLSQVGTYGNGEIKWQMKMIIQKQSKNS